MNNKKNIYLMNAIAFFQGIVIYATISTLYREARGLSLAQYGLIESFSYIFQLAFEIPFGFLADKIGYKKTLVVSNLFYFISKFVFFKANSFSLFLLERLFLSIALAGLSGVDISIIYLSSDENHSQKNFGLFASFGTAGMLFGSAVFTLLLSNDYAGCAFWTMIAYLIAFIISIFIDEVKNVEVEEKVIVNKLFSIMKLTIKDYKFLFFIFAEGLLATASWQLTVMLNQDVFISVGLNEQQMGVIAICISTVGLLTAYSANLTEKLGAKKFVILLTVASCIASLLMGFTRSSILAILANLVADFAYGLLMPLLSDLKSKRVVVEDRATQLSCYSMIYEFICMALTWVLSIVANIGFKAMFILCFMEYLIALLSMLYCYKNQWSK